MQTKKAPQKILGMLDFENRVYSCYSMVRSCRMSSAQEQEHIKQHVYAELDRKHGKRNVYSHYMQGYVYGLITAHRRELYRNDFEFCYLVDGTLYTTAKEETGKPKVEIFYNGEAYQKLNNAPNGHFWKGTDKNYFGIDKKSLDSQTQAE